jgi:hypothetical protein
MRMLSKAVAALAFAFSLFSATGCGPGNSTHADTSVRFAVLNGTDQLLRDDFNRDRGYVRLMFLVDPICPDCLRGLADMGDDVLAKLPKGARVKVYVVYEPVIGGKDANIPAAADLLHSTLAKHYWNPSGDFGRQMSHALGYRNGSRWIYAWDTWMIYPPDAVWTGANPPQPAFLMHQLEGLQGNPKFPFLDSKVFAAKVDAIIEAKAPAQ